MHDTWSEAFQSLSNPWLYQLIIITILPSQIHKAKNEKVENLNKIFTQVQRDVKSVSKSVAPEPKKHTQVTFHTITFGCSKYKIVMVYYSLQAAREPPKESVNVDNAAELFSQL